MKYIKIITNDNFPFGGAPANFVRFFALSLALNKDNDIEVVLPRGNSFSNNINQDKRKLGHVENVRFLHLGYVEYPKHFLGRLIDKVNSYILPLFYFTRLKRKNKLDKFIVYSAKFSTLLSLLFVKWLLRVDMTVIITEFYRKPSFINIHSYLNWLSLDLGIRYLAKYANKIIVLTTYLEEFMISRGVSTNRILLLPNITDPDVFRCKETKPYMPNKTTIGYCGTPTSKDGVVDLIHSFTILKKQETDIHLLIIGDAVHGRSLLPELKVLAKELCVAEDVSFTGLVAYNEIPQLLKSCQILALTRPLSINAESGFPTKLGEYFACCKPVLITNVGDVKKHFVHKKHLMIAQPSNLQDIVENFLMLIHDKQLCNTLIENSTEWLDNNLDYRRLSDKICSFLD